MKVFDKFWYEKHQQILLWFSNTKIGEWILGITKEDFDGQIEEIAPNYISHSLKYLKNGRIQKTTEFKSGEPYAQNLYEAFKPIWWLLHFWDWLVLDRFVPNWSFGFSTLTQNPQTGGGGGNVTTDGYVARLVTTENWATITSSAGNKVSVSSSGGGSSDGVSIQSSSTSNTWSYLSRSILTFDTSALTSSATISATVLSVYGAFKGDTLGAAMEIDIYTASPAAANNLVASDYGNCGTVSQTGSPLAYASFSTVGYNAFTFNTYANVSKTGVSKFSVRDSIYDVGGSTPPYSATHYNDVQHYYSDNGSNQPKLVVTYTTLTVYTMAATPATFSFTPQTEANHAIRKTAATVTAYTFTAKTAAMHSIRKMAATVTAYTFTPATVGIKKALTMIASVTAYTFTAVDATFKKALTMAVTPASYIWNALQAIIYKPNKTIPQGDMVQIGTTWPTGKYPYPPYPPYGAIVKDSVEANKGVVIGNIH